MTFDFVAEGGDDEGEDVFPVLHLYRQVSETDAELDPDRLGSGCILLQQS